MNIDIKACKHVKRSEEECSKCGKYNSSTSNIMYKGERCSNIDCFYGGLKYHSWETGNEV